MSPVHQQARRLAPQSYTISQLIQIARDTKYSFDLSKFTYDAARAGVVPPLGDIAVPTCRSSNPRVHAWSSETVEATSDVTSFSVNAALPGPSVEAHRQPSNPPAEQKSQKDAGFARFLKKHSSPTHNRVTTGGRIVPMEKRESPPKFDLSDPKASADCFQRGLRNEHDGLSRHGTLENLEANKFTNPEPYCALPPDVEETHESISAALQDVKDHINPAGTPPYFCGPQIQTHAFPAAAQYPPLPTYYYVPNPGYNGNIGYCAPAGWQCPAAPLAPIVERDKFEGVEPTTQLLVTAQSCLAQAQTQYSLLDRQLKAMDRHRAMSSHDPSLAAQRMAVVQQRADVKAMINRLSVQVDMLQSSKPVSAESPSGFAASARPFVPRSSLQHSPETSRPRSAGDSVELAADFDCGLVETSPVPVPRSRKIIPILPPHSQDLAKGHQSDHAAKCSETRPMWEVDLWGVRSRDASNKSAGTVLHQVAPIKTNITRDCVALRTPTSRKISKNANALPEIVEWKGGRPGPLPEELAGMTEVYYDALRLPVGVITVFALANGDSFEVCGADLQRSEKAMSETEQAYWAKKPTFTKQILDGLRSKAQIIDEEQYDDDYLLGNQRRTNAEAFDAQGLLEEAMRAQADRRQQAASAPQALPVLDRQEYNTNVTEDLSNKGFTSVSLQDVHAIVRLPPSFDGATDNGRRNAKAILTATNKNRSPRVLHRSTPNGGAWYGPHCHKVVL